jgi:transposase
MYFLVGGRHCEVELEWVPSPFRHPGGGHTPVLAISTRRTKDENCKKIAAPTDFESGRDVHSASTGRERRGTYRPAHRTSDKQRDVRAHLAVREALVRTRAKYISLIGALARREGCRIKTGASRSFAARVEQAELPRHVIIQIEPLLIMLKSLNEQIKLADEKLAEIVKDDEVVKRLTTVPGVGPVTATTYAATLDGAARFQDAKQVRSYLGLVPREHNSGEKQHRGRISKAGNSRARALLVEAAWALLRWKTPKTQALHERATKIAARRGKATAVVALARKLAGILFALWRDGTEFDPGYGTATAGS